MTIAIAVPHLTPQPQELEATPADSELQAMDCRGGQDLDPGSLSYGEIGLRCN